MSKPFEGGEEMYPDDVCVPLPAEQHNAIMAALNESEGLSKKEWDALFEERKPTVAEMYPVQPQSNGTSWYRSAPVRKDGREGSETLSFNQLGWTSNPGLADPSYGVGDGKGNAY